VAEKASFFSRFFYKILEIMGAAVATAVSGYVVAHLGGFLPSQNQAQTRTPPEIVAAPSDHTVPKGTAVNPPASQTPTAPQPTQSAAVPPLPEARPSVPQQETTGSSSQTVVRKTAKAPPVRKSGKPETAATEPSKPRETTDAKPRDGIEAKLREAIEAKPRDAAEAKPRDAAETKQRDPAEAKSRDAEDKESVEARVRAALANVDANRPPPADVPPRRGEGQASVGSARPGEASPGAMTAIPARPLEPPSTPAPRSADLGPAGPPPASPQPAAVQPAASAGQAGPPQPIVPPQPDALTTVEIKSRPVATIDTQRAPETPAQPPEERGVFSTIKQLLPDFSRPASNDETPRPPASVGD
jgi:hypothetical protein